MSKFENCICSMQTLGSSCFRWSKKVEINLRCRIANYFCEKYGVFGHREECNFKNADYHNEFMHDLANEEDRNAQSPFVKNFRQNYDPGELPLYAVVELLSFGTLSKLFKNMKNEDKKAIAKTFGVGYTYFESWIESIANVRNLCAHYGRLYNAKLTKTPILYDQYRNAGIGNNRVFAILFMYASYFGKRYIVVFLYRCSGIVV